MMNVKEAANMAGIRKLAIDWDDYTELLEQLEEFELRERKDHVYALSCGPRKPGEPFPFVTFGFTPFNQRVYIEEPCTILETVVAVFVSERPEGGRFFIDMWSKEWGAFYRTPEGDRIMFLRFESAANRQS